jgi:hypothetical protein
MDTLEINKELKKINALHGSLNEDNALTYIIFLESYRHKLNEAQIEWLDYKIDKMTEDNRQRLEDGLKNVDVELSKAPLTEKYQEAGELSIDR